MLRFLPRLISVVPIISGHHPNGLVGTSKTTNNIYYLISGQHGSNPLYHTFPDNQKCQPIRFDWMQVDTGLKGKSPDYFSAIQVTESGTKVYKADLYTKGRSGGLVAGSYGQSVKTVTVDTATWSERQIQTRLTHNVEHDVLSDLDEMIGSDVWTLLGRVTEGKVPPGAYRGTTDDGTRVTLLSELKWLINDTPAEGYMIEWFLQDGVIFVRLHPCGGGKVSIVVLRNPQQKKTSQGRPIYGKLTEWKI